MTDEPDASAAAPPKEWKRMSFQEAMELEKLPAVDSGDQKREIRFMNCQPPWMPGKELPWESIGVSAAKITRGAYGGVVYAMATLAAARVVEEEDTKGTNEENEGSRAIHVSETSYGADRTG